MTPMRDDEGRASHDLRGVVEVGSDGRDGRLDAWARAAWSVIAEPSDSSAGSLIAEKGAWGALAWAREPRNTATVAAACDLTEAALLAAHTRWAPRLDRGPGPALEAARRAGMRLVVPEAAEWPRSLGDLGPHAPFCLWVKGRIPTSAESTGPCSAADASGRALAVVGARAATGYGELVARELAADLSGAGVTIISGAAYGIDGAAHRAVLGEGGCTIAVLAGGVDRPYPRGHVGLLAEIAATGAVVSEVPPGTAPTRWRFLMRNRLIAAMSGAVVVAEAGLRSGSLNTAGHAASLGRPLGAVPGPVTSATSAGCHRLLRDYGATCITSAADALDLLGCAREVPDDPAARDSAEVTRVLDALTTREGRTAERIAALAGLSVDETRSILGLLAVEGRADAGAGAGAEWRAMVR